MAASILHGPASRLPVACATSTVCTHTSVAVPCPVSRVVLLARSIRCTGWEKFATPSAAAHWQLAAPASVGAVCRQRVTVAGTKSEPLQCHSVPKPESVSGSGDTYYLTVRLYNCMFVHQQPLAPASGVIIMIQHSGTRPPRRDTPARLRGHLRIQHCQVARSVTRRSATCVLTFSESNGSTASLPASVRTTICMPPRRPGAAVPRLTGASMHDATVHRRRVVATYEHTHTHERGVAGNGAMQWLRVRLLPPACP